MAKKTVRRKPRQKPEPVGELTPEEFYKMRLYAENLAHEETRMQFFEATRRVHELELQLAKIKHDVAERTLKPQKNALEQSRIEYNEIKSSLEKRLGQSLAECEIEEGTFKVLPIRR